MELEELKNLWLQSGTEPESRSKSDTELLNMRHEPSKSPVAKMQRNLFFELIGVLISVGVVAFYYFKSFDGKLQELSWVYITMAILFVWYYYQKNKLLKSMQCVTCRVKSNLEHQLKMLDRYVKLYLVIGTALIPILLYIMLYLLLNYERANILVLFSMESNEKKFILLYTLFAAIFTIIMYFINKWYIHLLYGRHIKHLKRLVGEMDEPDNPESSMP